MFQTRQVIAQRLLVETGLAVPGLIAVGRPEPRGVGRQDLVDHDQLTLRRRAEFEFGVGDDDAALRRVIAARLVQSQAGATQPLGGEPAEAAHDVFEGDVLVVPLLGLGRGRENRGIELGAFDEPLGHRLAGERSRFLILRPGRARDSC